MILKNIFTILTCLVLSASAVYASEDTVVEGVYEKVPGHEFRFDGKKVEIIEFLSLYCGHCYHFEKEIPVIRGNFPGKIVWKTVPIYWGNGSSKPGEAYFLAEEAGKGEDMKRAIFKAFFVDKLDISNIDVLEDIAMNLGLGFDFSRRLRGGEKAGDVGEALLLANQYGINSTPTLIIAGNLKTSPGMFSSLEAFRDNAITILKSILKKQGLTGY